MLLVIRVASAKASASATCFPKLICLSWRLLFRTNKQLLSLSTHIAPSLFSLSLSVSESPLSCQGFVEGGAGNEPQCSRPWQTVVQNTGSLRRPLPTPCCLENEVLFNEGKCFNWLLETAWPLSFYCLLDKYYGCAMVTRLGGPRVFIDVQCHDLRWNLFCSVLMDQSVDLYSTRDTHIFLGFWSTIKKHIQLQLF